MSITTTRRSMTGSRSRRAAPGQAIRTRGSRAARAVSLVVPALALTFALGSGAASAATSHPAQSAAHSARGQQAAAQPAGTALAGVSWHKLALLSGWTSSQGAYGTGDPAYAIKNGVVYLSGSLHGGSGELVAVLPHAARPARTLYLTVYTYNGTRGTLLIQPDGDIQAYSTPSANATLYTSLAAVSYPTAAITRHKLTLLHGWKSSQHQYGTGDPAYAIKNGVVYLSGSLHGGTSESFSVLPKAAWPASTIYPTVSGFGGTSSFIGITNAGGMTGFFTGAPGEFTSLAGLSYPAAAGTRHKLTLINGWKPAKHSFGGTGDPAYSVIGGVVYLSGALLQPAVNSDQFAVLPPAARPSGRQGHGVRAVNATDRRGRPEAGPSGSSRWRVGGRSADWLPRLAAGVAAGGLLASLLSPGPASAASRRAPRRRPAPSSRPC